MIVVGVRQSVNIIKAIELNTSNGCGLSQEKKKGGGGQKWGDTWWKRASPAHSLPALIMGSLVPAAMKVPTLKPSSVGAGLSSGSR